MKDQDNFKPYATIYAPTTNGIAHYCINHGHNHRTSGAMFVIELKSRAKGMPIFEITNTSKILGLNANNILKYGGRQIS